MCNQYVKIKGAPPKKIQEVCKQHNISWEQMDHLIMNAEPHELDGMNEGSFSERQKIINKYLL